MAEPPLQPLIITALREACRADEALGPIQFVSNLPFYRQDEGLGPIRALVLRLRFLQAQWNYTFFVWLLLEDGNHMRPSGPCSVSVSLSLPAGRDPRVRSRFTFYLSLTCAIQAQRHPTSLSIPATLSIPIFSDAAIREDPITVQNASISVPTGLSSL